jgi:hypothetical protein
MRKLDLLRDYASRYIDFGMAWKGALFLGGVVWLINLPHGAIAALPAALKQALYTFFVAGFITRLCQTLAIRLQPQAFALIMAVLVPSGLAVGLTYLVHSLKGTPEPTRSTIPTALTAPPVFFWWGRKGRRDHGTDLGLNVAVGHDRSSRQAMQM